jgi:hypothetical protein
MKQVIALVAVLAMGVAASFALAAPASGQRPQHDVELDVDHAR